MPSSPSLKVELGSSFTDKIFTPAPMPLIWKAYAPEVSSGIISNAASGLTFIEPATNIREVELEKKNPNPLPPDIYGLLLGEFSSISKYSCPVDE